MRYVLLFILCLCLASFTMCDSRTTEGRSEKRDTVTEETIEHHGTDANNFTQTTHRQEISRQEANATIHREQSSPVVESLGTAVLHYFTGGGFTGAGGIPEVLGSVLTLWGGVKVKNRIKRHIAKKKNKQETPANV